MTREGLADLLQRLEPELSALTAPWCLIGSAALIIAGAAWPECEDVDILTTRDAAAALERAWAPWRAADYVLDDSQPFRSCFSRYDFPQGAVEVMGGLELRTPAGWVPVEAREVRRISFAGGLWPVPNLEAQACILRDFGRPKDMAKLAILPAEVQALALGHRA